MTVDVSCEGRAATKPSRLYYGRQKRSRRYFGVWEVACLANNIVSQPKSASLNTLRKVCSTYGETAFRRKKLDMLIQHVLGGE